ncbi:hypothetical protein AB0J43_22485 [Nonomuraea fuscirosea]
MPEWIRDQLMNLAAVIGSVLDDPAADHTYMLRHTHEDLRRILDEDQQDNSTTAREGKEEVDHV